MELESKVNKNEDKEALIKLALLEHQIAKLKQFSIDSMKLIFQTI